MHTMHLGRAASCWDAVEQRWVRRAGKAARRHCGHRHFVRERRLVAAVRRAHQVNRDLCARFRPPPPPRARQARGQVRRRQHAATFFCRQSGANRRSPSRPTHLSARSRARESSGSPCTGTVSASSDPNVRGGADHSEWVVVSVEHERKAAAWSPRFSLWSPPDPKRETQPTPYAKDQR